MALRYEQLLQAPAQIRTLSLEPGSPDSPIHCRLQHASLQDPPEYEALSYVWGDPSDLKEIWVNNCLHHATPSLASALNHLRYADRQRVLWVDALCINQEDLLERGQQVQLMGSIYRQATRVVSWLGEADKDSDDGMRLLDEVGEWARSNIDGLDAFIEGDAGKDVSITEYFESLGFPPQTRNWDGLWKLLRRPYWTRVWIIQELAADMKAPHLLTSGKGSFICGNISVSRVNYNHAAAALMAIIVLGSSLSVDARDVQEPLRSMLINGHPPGLSMSQTLSGIARLRPELAWLLRLSRAFDATDKRDKIFALLGLASASYQEFNPDYSKPLRDVLIHITETMVRNDGNLDVLLGNRFRPNQFGPSWTPDVGVQIHGDSGLVPDEEIFHASGKSTPEVHFDHTSGIMRAKGILIGTLDLVIGPLRQGGSMPDGVSDMAGVSESLGHPEFFQRISQFSRSLDAASREDFWRTLVMNKNTAGVDTVYPAPANFSRMQRAFFGQENPPDDFMPTASRLVRVSHYAFPFCKSMEHAMPNRSFFRTACGKMGLGSYCARTGDVAVILYGCNFCFLLRQTGSGHVLIGDAYVHGVMNGELAGDGNKAEQTFVIY